MPVMCSCRNALIRAIQVAHGPVRLADVAAEPLRDEDDERQDGEGHEREPPVHRDEHDHDAGEREDVAEDRDDAGREQVVEHVDVGRHARHQPADGVAVVELQVEALQVPVDLHAHVVHDPLPGHLQRPGLDELEHERADQDREEGQRNPIDAAQIAVGDVAIDRQLHQVRLRELQHRGRDDRGERQRHLRLVRPQVLQQPAHQACVVGLAEDFFVVERH